MHTTLTRPAPVEMTSVDKLKALAAKPGTIASVHTGDPLDKEEVERQTSLG